MYQQENFEQEDYSEQRPFDGEVYECTFKNCDFTSSDLSDVSLVDCTFESCNFSMVELDGARLRGVSFANCKLLGVDFSTCSDFGFAVDFEGCNLDFSSFWRKEMPRTNFASCTLTEANLVEADLTEAVLSDCDLSQASFERTILESADLRGSRNFSIDPTSNRIRHAKFSRAELGGLLHKYDLEID